MKKNKMMDMLKEKQEGLKGKMAEMKNNMKEKPKKSEKTEKSSKLNFDKFKKDKVVKTKEPKVKEPKVKEPKVKEPKVKEPKVKEPKVKEPKIKEPKVKEPKIKMSKFKKPEKIVDNAENSAVKESLIKPKKESVFGKVTLPKEKVKKEKVKKEKIKTDKPSKVKEIFSGVGDKFKSVKASIAEKKANKTNTDKSLGKEKIKVSKTNKLTNFIKINKKNKIDKAEDKGPRETKMPKGLKRKKVTFKEFIKSVSTRSINGRIISLVLISSICIAALITIPSALLIVNSIRTSVNSELSTMTDTYSKYINLANERLKESIETVGRMSQITDESMSLDEQKNYLASLCREMTFDSITIANITGKTLEGDSVFSEKYFSNARMGETYLTSPTYSTSTRKNENIVAAQITNGSSAGVVIATVNTDYYNNMIASYMESTLYGGHCFIVDADGKIISHHDSELITAYADDDVEETKSFESLVEKMTEAEEPALSDATLNDGEEYYIGYAPIEGDEDWCIAAAIPKSEVNKKIISNLLVVILLALLLIVAAAVFSLITAKSISEPIISLTGRVVTLAEGDLMEDVPRVETKDETLQLYNAMKSTVKNLSVYVSEIDTVLSAIANRDLCVNAKAEYHGDFANIKHALTKITIELNEFISDIKRSSDQVAHGANEMSESATSLANGATAQTAALNGVMIEIADVANLAKSNVEIAAATQLSVNEMADSVSESSTAMNEMLSAMSRLEKSSNEIQGIVSVIENIMFQTNILALNASIEASKAGVHGKGFSVVAGEIRNLSENCSGVLKKIAKLIKDSLEDTENSVQLAGNVSAKLDVLVENAVKTTKSVVEIADASQKQAESIEKMKNGLDKIDSVVQSNSAMSEQTAAVSQELKDQAYELMKTVSKFKLSDNLPIEEEVSTNDEETSVEGNIIGNDVNEDTEVEVIDEVAEIAEDDIVATNNEFEFNSDLNDKY